MSTIDTQARTDSGLRRVSDALCALGRRARALLLIRAVSLSLSVLLTAVLALTLLDYLIRFPQAVRMLALIGLLAIVWRVSTRLLLPAIRARFSPVDLALRIEQRDPSARGLLASAVDLEHTRSDNPVGSALRDAALSRAAQRAASAAPALRLDQTLKAFGLLLLIGVLVLIPIIQRPTLARIGAQRTLAPWSSATWPKRFSISDNTKSEPHAIDKALPVRVSIGPSTADARAIISWRVLDKNGDTITQSTRSVLAAQPIDPAHDGRIYEHLLDARAIADRNNSESFILEYRIRTKDDETPATRITLARPPSLSSTTISVQRPDYAVDATPQITLAESSASYTSEQIISDPILAGSTVAIRWTLSKPIAIQTDQQPAWISSIADRIGAVRLTQPTPETVELRFIASEQAIIEPLFRDRLGIAVRSRVEVDLSVHSDAAPTAVITQPDRDLMITTHAQLDLGASFSDDIGLAHTRIELVHAIRPADSPGAIPEPTDPIVLHESRSVSSAHIDERVTLNVSELDTKPGDELWISAAALDLLGASQGHPASTSETRTLRIVDDQTLIEQIQRSIAPVREALQRLDEQQAALQEQLHDGALESARTQRTLAEQLGAQRRLINRIEQTAAQNTIDDPSLRTLLSDADALLEQATDAADRAADAIDQSRDESAQREQQRVRDRLGELLSILDRGEDAWLARRSVQQLRDELERLNNETNELNASTAGKSLDQLSADERTTLERILDRQRAAAENAQSMLDELDQRAEELQDTDPTQAEALRRAASQGRGAQIGQTLDQASDELSENQTGAASQSQQAAMNELDQMLEEIDQAAKNRDSALRRQLASIIDQLRSLIAEQQRQLARVHSGDDTLDDELIALVRNTLAVRDTATGAFPETRTIADAINRAADQQSLAITAIRAEPSDPVGAEQHERNALTNLEQALADAERLEQQAEDREARRLREELRGKYSDALQSQVSLRDLSAPLIDQSLSRKQRSEARALSASQLELRAALETLITETEGLGDAEVFALAHAQLDRVMTRAASALTERTPPPSIRSDHEQAILLLSALVEVLSDPPPQEQDFEDGSGDSGGSGSGNASGEQPLVPPIAQLRLLRSIQQLAAMQTRALSESGSPDAESVRALVELQQEIAIQGQELVRQLNQPQSEQQPMEITPEESSE